MSFQFPEQPQHFSKTVLAEIFVKHVTEGNYSFAVIIPPSWGHMPLAMSVKRKTQGLRLRVNNIMQKEDPLVASTFCHL